MCYWKGVQYSRDTSRLSAMIYVQCLTHAVRQSVVSVVIPSILRDPMDAEKNLLNLDNIDVQLSCMHFRRATGGVFLRRLMTMYLK